MEHPKKYYPCERKRAVQVIIVLLFLTIQDCTKGDEQMSVTDIGLSSKILQGTETTFPDH